MSTDHPSNRAERSVLLATALSAIGAGVIAIASLLQIALSFYFCSQEVGRDLGHNRSAVAELELDVTPVVVCKTAEGTMEFPIAGAVTSLGAAVVLLVAVLVFFAWHRARS